MSFRGLAAAGRRERARHRLRRRRARGTPGRPAVRAPVAGPGRPIRAACCERACSARHRPAAGGDAPAARSRSGAAPGTSSRPSPRSRPTRSRRPTRSPTRSSAKTGRPCPASSATCCCRSSTTRRWALRQGRFDFEQVAARDRRQDDRAPSARVRRRSRWRAARRSDRVWEDRKAAERAARGGDGSVLADVPLAFPALTRALKLQKRAARVGFDWGAAGPILAKIEEEIAELRDALAAEAPAAERELELGDLLFTVVEPRAPSGPRPRSRAARRPTPSSSGGSGPWRPRRVPPDARPSELSLGELEALWKFAKAREQR